MRWAGFLQVRLLIARLAGRWGEAPILARLVLGLPLRREMRYTGGVGDTATIVVTEGSPLKYDRFNVTHRLSVNDGQGWHPSADMVEARRRMDESYRKWRAAHPRVRRLPRYTDASRWVSPGYTYFTTENTEAGTVAFVDLEVYGQSNAVLVAYLSVRPDHRGEGLARRLMQEVYDRWPEARVYWGKIIASEIGHLYEDFKARYPDRTPHAKRDF